MRRLSIGLLVTLATACRAAPIPDDQRFPAGTQFTARLLQIDGTRIRYVDAGQGLAVVFIHGLGASMYTWRNNLAPVLAAGFRVVAFDNRGFGSSDKPAHGYTNAEYVHLAVGLLDSLHLPDAVVVGHSMGGEIAAELAIISFIRHRFMDTPFLAAAVQVVVGGVWCSSPASRLAARSIGAAGRLYEREDQAPEPIKTKTT